MTYEKKDIDNLRIVLSDIGGIMYTDSMLVKMLELCEIFHHFAVLKLHRRESFEVSNVIEKEWAKEVIERLEKLEKPKKTVVKEAVRIGEKFHTPNSFWHFAIPDNAKNIKCTYEIDG